ncbi:MAG TPA: hypothetical protein VGE06_09625, partial [Flavisolibacter sp.]
MGGFTPLLPTGSQMAGAVFNKNPLTSVGLGLLTSNPVGAGLGLISGLGGMFGGGSKMSSATASASSGIGSVTFGNGGLNRPWLDLEKPQNLAIAAL